MLNAKRLSEKIRWQSGLFFGPLLEAHIVGNAENAGTEIAGSENAGSIMLEIAGPNCSIKNAGLKMQDRKVQDLKLRDQNAYRRNVAPKIVTIYWNIYKKFISPILAAKHKTHNTQRNTMTID